MDARTNNIPVRFNDTELAIMKRLAARDKMDVAKWIRSAVYGEMLMSMDRQATLYVVKGAVGTMRRRLQERMADWPFEEELKEKA